MSPIDVDAVVREEWRKLQFFYDLDENPRVWRLAGSRDGLKHFATLLREYVSNPVNQMISEHEHYGPYMYLKIVTWTEPEIRDDAIVGTLSDLARLADIVDRNLESARAGDAISIAQEYVEDAEYDLVLEVHPEDTDPAALETSN
ncbi:MAG: hypothetical protein HON04_09435 [Planctomicrobium sp.]|nr:hypothetical protein [Planctomicrobium sp.]